MLPDPACCGSAWVRSGARRARKLSKSEVFTHALAESAKRTGQSLVAAAKHPKETVKGVPQGVGRFFQRVGGGR